MINERKQEVGKIMRGKTSNLLRHKANSSTLAGHLFFRTMRPGGKPEEKVQQRETVRNFSLIRNYPAFPFAGFLILFLSVAFLVLHVFSAGSTAGNHSQENVVPASVDGFPRISPPNVLAAERQLVLVRVFEDGKFVDNLKTGDFLVQVSDRPVEVKGLTLVRNLKVRMSEGENIDSPILPRVIILDFRCYQYEQKLGQMVEQVFRRPYSSSDLISLVTPIKAYSFSEKTLRDYQPEELINAGTSVLKRDISVYGKTEDEIIQELTRLVLDLQQGASPKETLTQYQQNLESLKAIRKFDEMTLLRASTQYTGTRAQKRYVVVWQQEFLPIPSPEMMDRLLANQNVMFQASELFRTIEADRTSGLEPLISELVAAGIVVDFIYYKINPRPRPDIKLREFSTDMYDLYGKVARGTGGGVEATGTPMARIKKILDDMENYYLLSLEIPAPGDEEERPRDVMSGVKIKVRNRDYRLEISRLEN